MIIIIEKTSIYSNNVIFQNNNNKIIIFQIECRKQDGVSKDFVLHISYRAIGQYIMNSKMYNVQTIHCTFYCCSFFKIQEFRKNLQNCIVFFAGSAPKKVNWIKQKAMQYSSQKKRIRIVLHCMYYRLYTLGFTQDCITDCIHCIQSAIHRA